MMFPQTYQIAKQIDIEANEAIGGNLNDTISIQDGRGVQSRRPELSLKDATTVAHWNMAAAGGALVGGICLMRKSPAVATVLIVLAVIIALVVISDWHNGKRN